MFTGLNYSLTDKGCAKPSISDTNLSCGNQPLPITWSTLAKDELGSSGVCSDQLDERRHGTREAGHNCRPVLNWSYSRSSRKKKDNYPRVEGSYWVLRQVVLGASAPVGCVKADFQLADELGYVSLVRQQPLDQLLVCWT